ncbi:hypothetical protein SADO_00790 [Salinisphaera dokdonensis CL-ES53]|uniref:Uncharacterized protein n=1 Tax=Salinisphaera dokdonensis CL-ES53 TaxID=1304272 RepID=A0ABV2AVV7_9GAMM
MWFGEKFAPVPVTEFMLFEEYLEFLKNINIAVFNY